MLLPEETVPILVKSLGFSLMRKCKMSGEVSFLLTLGWTLAGFFAGLVVGITSR